MATTEPPDYFLAADFVVSCLGCLFFLSFFCALLPLPILRPPCVKLAQDIDVPVQIVENPGIFGGFGRTVMNFGPAS